MIYVSSACVKREKIKDAVEFLARNGFRHIELSGGTRYYEGLAKDLFQLKKSYNLDFLVHNYFPPPQEELVLNLASLDKTIHAKTTRHFQEAINLSRKLGAKKFGIHAGYFIDFSTREIGNPIALTKMNDPDRAMDRFCQGFQALQAIARSEGITLYLENNVLSEDNARNFQGKNPFMVTDKETYLALRQRMDFPLLLDVAHLRVSAQTLGLSFEEQMDYFMDKTDYIHVSDNDGKRDANFGFSADSPILQTLSRYAMRSKIITIEVYGTLEEVRLSRDLLSQKIKTV
jgi:sugar phosphate isomerase/epimerase